MLAKQVCQKCHDEHRSRKWSELPGKDRLWKKGFVNCVMFKNVMHKNGRIPIKGKLPLFCPYLTEHVVCQEKRR